MGVIFAADLSQELIKANVLFNPSNKVSRVYNIYESYLGPYLSTYWTEWGGWYDNIKVRPIEIYIGSHNLIQVVSLSDCCNQEWSIFNDIEARMVYINIPKHSWLYDEATTNFRNIISFLSAPKNPNNPSDDIIDEEHWQVRLEVPKFTVKLSDVINGLTKYSTFDFTLYNNDGYFDDLEATNFFNGPSYIKKTWKENPEAKDFLVIRAGKVESIKIDDKVMTVSNADLFRTLEQPVCKIVKEVFPTAIENTDKNLPVVYGIVTIPLIEINTSIEGIEINELQYVAGENITNVIAVYDKDDEIIPDTDWYFENGIITSYIEASYAIVIGNTNNRIGEIITDLIANKAYLTYVYSFWDIAETDIYKDNSPHINIAFTDGAVNEAVKKTLSSDMAFLIQKNDGKFTLREWGKTYNTFKIESWEITNFPTKNYSNAQKNYQSSCLINYDYDFQTGTFISSLLYNANERSAEDLYGKLVRKEFETYLTNHSDADILAKKLSDRFSVLKENVQVAVGYNTSEINLLDNVRLELTINGRSISKYTDWVAIEIDPAQDILTLEPIISSQ
jgi:hypothetical protein